MPRDLGGSSFLVKTLNIEESDWDSLFGRGWVEVVGWYLLMFIGDCWFLGDMERFTGAFVGDLLMTG